MPDDNQPIKTDRNRPSPLTRGITGVYTAAAAGVVGVGSWLLKRSGQWPADGLRERWARDLPPAPDSRPIWIHAASMGEVRIGGLFAGELMSHGEAIIASTMTEAGYKLAGDVYANGTPSFRVPFDLPGPIRRVIRHYNPRAIVLIETEWWPNLLLEASRAGLPVFIVNGRLSKKAFGRYRLGRGYWRRILSVVEFFYMRGNPDADRLLSIGVDSSRVKVYGTMKSVSSDPENSELTALAHSLCSDGERVWIAGCTRPGEEEIVLEAFDSLRKEYPNLQLWLAPRHANRFAEVAELLAQQGRSVLRLSECTDITRLGHSPSVVLVDRLGVLAHLYQYADVAFIGGSLLQYGGHNPLEPALVGTPVTFGPFMDGQRDAVDLLADTALSTEVWGAESLAIATAEFLRSEITAEQRRAHGDKLRARILETQRCVAADLLSRLPMSAANVQPTVSSV